MPTHNAAPFIHRGLESVLEPGADLEVIVVDDGSTDDTRAVVSRYAATDSRVRLLIHPAARGPSAARNTAINAARGDWLALLDADDAFAPGRIAALTADAERRGLDAICDNLRLFEFDGWTPKGLAFEPGWVERDEPISLAYLLARDWPGAFACTAFGTMKPVMRRSFVQRHRLRYAEDLWLGEDLLFYANLLLADARFGVTPQALYHYAVRSESLSARPKPNTALVEVNRRISAARAVDDETRALLRRREHALWFQVCFWYVRAGMPRKAVASALNMPPAFLLGQALSRIGKRLGVVPLGQA